MVWSGDEPNVSPKSHVYIKKKFFLNFYYKQDSQGCDIQIEDLSDELKVYHAAHEKYFDAIEPLCVKYFSKIHFK